MRPMTDMTPAINVAPARWNESARSILAPIVVAAAIAVPYLAFPAANLSWAEDVTSYMAHVRAGAPAVHPNHLLTEHVYFGFDWVLRRLGFDGPVDLSGRWLTLVAAFVALATLSRMILAATASAAGAIAGAGIVAFSFAFWHYSTLAETYVLPLACALVALALVQKSLASQAQIDWRDGAVLALAASVATLTHQMFFFLQAAIAIRMSIHAQHLGRGSMGASLSFLGVSAALVPGSYVLAFQAVGNGDFLHWTLGHASSGLWETPTWASPLKAVAGMLIAILPPQVLFADPTATEMLHKLFPGKLLVEEIYLARSTLGPVAVSAIYVSTTVAIASTVGLGLSWLRGRRQPPAQRQDRAFSHFVGAIVATYAVLITIWEPMNIEFWISNTAFLTLWLSMQLDWSRRVTRSFAALLIAGIAGANLLACIAPLSQQRADYWYQINMPVIEMAQPGDIVVTPCGYLCRGYLTYFSAAAVVAPDDPALAEKIGLLPRGGRVFLSSWIVADPEPRGVSAKGGDPRPRAWLVRLFPGITMNALPDAAWGSQDFTIYRSDVTGFEQNGVQMVRLATLPF